MAAPDSVTIREAAAQDRDAIWKIFQATVAPGDSFVYDPNTSREEALGYWFGPGTLTYVATKGDKVIGSSILRPNRPGLGGHVANAGFMVDPGARRLGVGQLMGEHALNEARRLGYRAMQFNFVVSTNTSAVRLWEKLGFKIVGTLPSAFRHSQKGFVDAYVMFRSLEEA
jgi:ribosomal protein S18 acetylase RimI-like enzyme